jgi:hypothetical protein
VFAGLRGTISLFLRTDRVWHDCLFTAIMAKTNGITTCPLGHFGGRIASGTVKAGGQDKPAPGEYIRWDAEGVEVVPEGEQAKIQAVSDQFNRFQMMNFNEHMHCLRGTHLKTQGVRQIKSLRLPC